MRLIDKLNKETAFALCRMANEGNCRCEQRGVEFPCVQEEKQVEANQDYLNGMREAMRMRSSAD